MISFIYLNIADMIIVETVLLKSAYVRSMILLFHKFELKTEWQNNL